MMVPEKAPQKERFALDFEEGAIIYLVKIEVHFKTEEGAFAKAQICKRKHLIWGTEQELIITLPPASFSALWDGRICSSGIVVEEALCSLCCGCFNPGHPFLFLLFVCRLQCVFLVRIYLKIFTKTNLDELDKLNYCLWLNYFEWKPHLISKKTKQNTLKWICIASLMAGWWGNQSSGENGPSSMGEENRTRSASEP